MSRKNRAPVPPAKDIAVVPTQAPAGTGKRWMAADGYTNFEARVGFGTNNQSSGASYGFTFITRNRVQLDAMYRSSWIVGQAVDVVAKDMTRAWIDLKGKTKPDDIAKLKRGMTRLRLKQQVSECLRWSRLYGGSVGVLLIDGQDMKTPLLLDTIRKGQFKGILPLDRWLVQPTMQELVTDFGPDLGLPKFYDIVADSLALRRQRIHHSRILRFGGELLPYWQKTSESLWGMSVVERLYDRLIAFDSTTAGAAQLVFKAHLRTLKVEGLRDVVAAGGPALDGLSKTVEFMRRTQSNEGLTIIDGKDEFETHQYTFTGLDDVLMQFGQQLAGALGIPLVRLFGQSPAGLNSTGESDLKMYYNRIAQEQEDTLLAPLSKVLEVLHRSELGTEPAEDFDLEFTPLSQMTAKERSEVTKTSAEAILGAFEAGLIGAKTALQELRQLSDDTGIFTNITDEQIDRADEDPPEPVMPGDLNADPDAGQPAAQDDPARASGPAGNVPVRRAA